MSVRRAARSAARRVLVWNANPTLDVVSIVPSVRLGEVHLATEQTFSAGGKGTLVMRGLNALGVDYLGVTPVAGPSGDLVEQLIREEGLTSEFSRLRGSTRAAVTFVDGGGVDTNVNGPGPSAHDDLWRGHVERMSTLISSTSYDVLVIAGRPPPSADPADLGRLCRLAAEHGMHVVLDVAQPFLEFGLAERPWLVKVNRAEAEGVATPKRPEQAVPLPELADGLVARGAENVVLTDGPDPIEARLLGQPLVGNPPKVDLRSAIGCGDAFLAGLLYGLIDVNAGAGEALRWAVAVAAASAEDLRPGFFSLGRAEHLLPSVKVWRSSFDAST